ncbi:MAG: sugar kinase [Actinobacteria bacterium]|nr:sugar kinase [Actinomycetota bacterium]
MTQWGGSVVVIGDIVVDVSAALLEPIVPNSDTPAAVIIHAGGSGANQAAWLASCGVKAHFVGRIGDDDFGRKLGAELESSGVEAHLGVDRERATGVIVVVVHASGERDMLTDRGANLGLELGDLPSELFASSAVPPSPPRAPGHLHLSGYTFFDSGTRAVAFEAMALAGRAGLTVSVDPSSESFLGAVGAEKFLSWTKPACLCFPNLDEGKALTGADSPVEIALRLRDHYGAVALKLGARGGLYLGRTGEPLEAAAPPAEVVDTTGAGDAFCAGFLASWLDGAGDRECLERAVALSAGAVAIPGPRP